MIMDRTTWEIVALVLALVLLVVLRSLNLLV